MSSWNQIQSNGVLDDTGLGRLLDRIKLYCKGADSAILKRLKNSKSPTVEATIQHVEDFSRSGYRTLCIAEREVYEKIQ